MEFVMHRIRAAAILAMWVLLGVAHAQPVDRHTEFLRKSGLWDQLAAMEPAIQQGIAKAQIQFGTLDSRTITAFRRAASEVYAVDRLRDAVHDRLSSTTNDDDLGPVLAWLDTPLGARITRLEETASAQHSALSNEAVAEAFASLPTSRAALLKRLSAASDLAAATANVIVNTAVGIAHGVAACTANNAPASEIERRAPLMRAQLKGALEPTILAMSAITYASLSDAELEQYVTFLETDVTRNVNSRVITAVNAALSQAAQDLGRRIGEDAASEAAKAKST